ncbi:U4/U6.U5 tri-snRNP-associated protein 1 [Psilocybe cubensis]|uniref:U4/U6.U5 tri-snRNP-associated protein 1 n=2 Tax=Psilocybe cubensis TaxID=181762 RepID=A0ACB8H1Y7_PSICU|nr:U4/U6.U5 tri-snRNP-associated protein 1 [Psilocybe cubensis]KAH9481740.1 U4/U6.U5 tri-snRNP-associated protein 1 [Psilocybe cubensis]
MSMEESISLEETNKIRISLGLKPLTDDKAPEDKDKQAEDNYAKLREKEAKEREAKKIQDKIAKVRNRRELNTALKGATLGDAEEGVDDTLQWIKRNKRKEKELAKKRQQEFENRDKEIQQDYTERDLVGLKVSHDFDEMDEGEARILTLKDSRILDNEEDELQNVEMAEEERRKQRQELKIKKRDYTGYDDDEFGENHQGLMKRSILAKYDEDIEGPRSTEFRLGSSTISNKVSQEEKKLQTAAALNKTLLNIDYAKNISTADYLQEGDVGFKKPKTKKKRPSRRVPADSELAKDSMDVDEPAAPMVRNLDANFVDDDELQAALARSRKAKLHKTKKISPEELAKKIAEERAKEEEEEKQLRIKNEDPDHEEEGGLTFDETSEFVQAVGNNPIVKPKPEPKEVKIPAAASQPTRVKSEPRDVSMADGDVALDELEAGEVRVKDEEDDDYDMGMLDDIENAIKLTEAEEEAAALNGTAVPEVGTSGEQSFSTGMASTLAILRQQGILAQPTADQLEREKTQRQRDLWLADQRRRVAQRELERLQSRGANKDQAQREYENRLREQQEARDNMEAFKNYKPDVNIVYYDEFGRALSAKEAWKALSHKFHGKGSGKMKTEKRLKKIAEEKKKEAMVSGDTPLSMNRAFQLRQEKAGQAHFVLSVGNRGAVPQASEFLDAQPLAKGKTEKTKKKKESKNAQKAADSGFMTVPAPQGNMTSNGVTPATSASASPAPRAGFSRISSAVVEAPSPGGSSVPSDRVKVAFGLGTKRKAGEEAQGSPPPKRR